MVRRMRAFAVANEMSRGGSFFRDFVGSLVVWYAFVVGGRYEDSRAFLVVQSFGPFFSGSVVRMNMYDEPDEQQS